MHRTSFSNVRWTASYRLKQLNDLEICGKWKRHNLDTCSFENSATFHYYYIRNHAHHIRSIFRYLTSKYYAITFRGIVYLRGRSEKSLEENHRISWHFCTIYFLEILYSWHYCQGLVRSDNIFWKRLVLFFYQHSFTFTLEENLLTFK